MTNRRRREFASNKHNSQGTRGLDQTETDGCPRKKNGKSDSKKKEKKPLLLLKQWMEDFVQQNPHRLGLAGANDARLVQEHVQYWDFLICIYA